jgi:hypothetical protein
VKRFASVLACALLLAACDDTDLAPVPGSRANDNGGNTATQGGSSAVAGASGASGGSGASAGHGVGGSAGKSGGGSGGVVGSMGLGGASGTGAHAGASGASGASGTSGHAGASGHGGSGGASGASGHAGASGVAGSGGASGTSANAGAGGASGTGGASGASGASGAGGASGASGASGSAGAGGASGMSGASGGAGAPSCNPLVEEHPIEGAMHVAICSPVTYGTNPPSSGNHYPIWADFGTYDMPVPRGFYVHDLEHGAVVFTYNCPSGCDDQVAAAQALLDAHQDPLCTTPPPRARIVMTPDPLLDVTFAASAWGWTLRADCFDPVAFGAFLEGHFGQGPEALCIAGEDPFMDPAYTATCGM